MKKTTPSSYIYVFVFQNKGIAKPFELLLWHIQSFSCLEYYIYFCLNASVLILFTLS